jgi:hypothetical protein
MHEAVGEHAPGDDEDGGSEVTGHIEVARGPDVVRVGTDGRDDAPILCGVRTMLVGLQDGRLAGIER